MLNRQLAKLLSGFVTGQIAVAKVVVTVAAQSLAWGKWPAATLELSPFLPEVAAVCLVVFGFLFSSLFWCRLETTGLFFGPTNRRSKNMYQVSVFSLSDVGDIFCARSSRALPSWQPLRPFSRFSQRTLSFLHIFLFPVTSETASRSLSRGWRCSAVSRATLFCRSSPTEPGQSPRSPVSIRKGVLC